MTHLDHRFRIELLKSIRREVHNLSAQLESYLGPKPIPDDRTMEFRLLKHVA